MFIQRDYQRTEHDDFVLRVAPQLDGFTEAVMILSEDGKVYGWKLRYRYE